jgi:hypothetical protein
VGFLYESDVTLAGMLTIFVENNFADAFGRDETGSRIFDTCNMSVYFPEHFRSIYPGVYHTDILRIPDGGAAVNGKKAVFNQGMVVVPERVFTHKFTLVGLYIITFFKSPVSSKISVCFLHGNFI